MSIEIQNLSFSYKTQPVLRGVTFTARPGRLLAVLGPNGVGKSTLFRCILGLLRHYEGEIFIDGTSAKALSALQLARRIAYIPQTHQSAFPYSVLDMALMGTAHRFSPFSVPGRREKEQAMDALRQIGVSQHAQKSSAQLSGGEQQLVLIARAIAQQTKILVMDEPTSNLDFGNQLRILQRVSRLADEGYAVLLSSHNPQHALQFADEALALYGGGVAAFGPPKDVVDAPLLRRLYGVNVRFVESGGGERFIIPDGDMDFAGGAHAHV
jgi:ABC-type cobalamin/Fe3+-siderophores transport system ATPase subunit